MFNFRYILLLMRLVFSQYFWFKYSMFEWAPCVQVIVTVMNHIIFEVSITLQVRTFELRANCDVIVQPSKIPGHRVRAKSR